ncbi:MAG TPA: DnaJ C-terminal domain-containing protein [Acidimicrobiales bacterium]|nr:DnaJ C-terminal domain-containing protein [Acidimicrobiales bacterium]
MQADWQEKDLYAVLGVDHDADAKAIGRAYRKLARQLHPDTHPDDAAAVERFKEVTAAYDVLGEPSKRAEYDEFRAALAEAQAWPREQARRPDRGGPDRSPFDDHGFPGDDLGGWRVYDATGGAHFDPEDLDDLLGGLLGRSGTRPGRGARQGRGARRGDDLEAVLDLGFEDAVRGLTTQVIVDGPDGSRPVKVRVPPGVDDGQRIRLPGLGGPGRDGGPPGDLYALVRVASHPVFSRRGRDLTVDARISWPEAVLGTEIDVPTFDGPTVRVRVPAGTPHGRTLRVRGRGVRTPGGTGDLLVTIGLHVPDRVTDEQRQAVEALAAAFDAA